MRAGLRVDVDTFRGTRLGVPALCRLLAERSIRASFFFTVGPDNMGRHLWRLLKPAFLWKMLRTNAAGLYGWDILLRGAFWPGPLIGQRLAPVIRAAADAGHECGFHAWDHHRWQARIDRMSPHEARDQIARGVRGLEAALGHPPACSATAGWRTTDDTLRIKADFPFAYNSDCRGTHIFRPVVDGRPLPQPQIPVTLPTYDEMLGHDGVTNENYNARLLDLFRADALNVLTIHAEAEGIACLPLFADFLERTAQRGIDFVPLHDLLDAPDRIPEGRIVPRTLPGREGWIAFQA